MSTDTEKQMANEMFNYLAEMTNGGHDISPCCVVAELLKRVVFSAEDCGECRVHWHDLYKELDGFSEAGNE